MTIEAQLAQLQQAATEQTEASVQLANNITEGLQEIDQVKQDIAKAYDTVSQNNQALNDWQTQSGSVNLKDLNGNSHTLPTLKSLVADAQSVNPNPHVMTKAQFDALRDMRKQQYAGSGFVEWGKHYDSGVNAETVNEGMDLLYGQQYLNFLKLGSKHKSSTGSSKTYLPIVVIDGTTFELSDGVGLRGDGTAVTNGDEWKRALFPPAPDGTKTYDSATGTVTQHNNAEAAFAAETETNKVITSRKDLVFLEAWHEKIADKDVVYPLGNVQYGASSYKGIGLRNNLVAQGYSAFGEWDSATKGYGIKWSSLTEAQKAIFLGEPEHNIYYDPEAKAYIQVRYRIRVEPDCGLGWKGYLNVSKVSESSVIRGTHPHYLRLQGVNIDFNTIGVDNLKLAYTGADRDKDIGTWGSRSHCLAIPIALVQRLNQGAYHPSYNPLGCKMWNDVSTGTGGVDWHKASAGQMTNTTECFKQVSSGQVVGAREPTGKLGQNWSGRPDQYRYHDAIYAGQVEDLRLSAKKQDVNKLRESKLSDAIAGKFRGKEKLPFTKLKSGFCYDSGMTIYIFQNVPSSESSLIGSDKYYRGDDIVKSYPKYSEFKASAVAIKFTDAGDTDLTTFAGGTPLGQWFIIDKFDMQSHLFIALINPNTGNPHWFSSGRASTIQAELLFPTEQSNAEFETLSWTDIVATPDNFKSTFPDGVQGQWIPKLPDGTAGYPLNRKLSDDTLSATFSSDHGQTWVKNNVQFDPVKNINSASWDANTVALLQYQSDSVFTHAAKSTTVCGDIGRVYATQAYMSHYGNRLLPSLTGQVGKRNSGAYFQEFLNVSKHAYYSPTQTLGWTSHTGDEPIHEPLNLDVPNDNSPAVKALSTITEKNGLLYLQFHGSELKYKSIHLRDVEVIEAGVEASVVKGKVYRLQGFDNAHLNRPVIALKDRLNFTFSASAFDGYRVAHDGRIMTSSGAEYSFIRVHNNDWGDDQTIPIINGENTKTDLNGNTVKVFCHHTLFPIGIAHNG
ncbi:hypothetical protein J8Z24_05120 [Pseudoalteromonas sp. SCSIO 43201]|uniref:hypothetical protein n=1 Tax=Pseudoalteromonas sp. SCSIO 43201 TaxID=2822842 RepID=UPI002075D899|nr:hypothetical protein [Pseudoalteromonas sp. SCSIO 43201]USD29467.1 hypothetical protein J8Z24_05120 [Pseudoalteromonas sp. SCSIO 43201]